MNSLRSALTAATANHESPDIRAKENIRYELTQPQNALTSTGPLMEGLNRGGPAERMAESANALHVQGMVPETLRVRVHCRKSVEHEDVVLRLHVQLAISNAHLV